MPLLTRADAPKFNLPTAEFTGMASPSRGASETAVWRIRVAPESTGLAHQLSREEIFVALAGNAVARVGEDRHELAAGDTLIVPPFTDFALDNPATAPFEAIAVFPVGGRALVTGQPPFTPPWAQ